MAYTPQFYSRTVINRPKHLGGNLEKLRDLPEADVTEFLTSKKRCKGGHPNPGKKESRRWTGSMYNILPWEKSPTEIRSEKAARDAETAQRDAKRGLH